MNWLAKIMGARDGATGPDTTVVQTIENWKALPACDPNRPHFEARYVIVNTEASGLNLDHDTLLSVAAIGINEGILTPEDSFYAALEPHPAATLAALLQFAKKEPLVVFNAGFNRSMLERAFDTHLGFIPDLIWLDLFILLPTLFPDRINRNARLADWMEAFNIETFQRHHALGDAFVIAQLMLSAQARALAHGANTPRALAEMERARRQLQRQG
ncbi:MAG: 3'-5' exonuclease [Azoarcus sp.]|jgi:DNA polymerase-3 subunit epsilon|nr:3'-5' exonuclease [Azoarcus sp.]